MAFINAILDEAVAYGFEGGPEYSSSSVDLENGIQIRDSKWKFPRHKYSGQFDNMDDDAKAEVIKVFHAVRGKRHSFKFKDWNDYIADDEALNVNIGSTDAVQLYKTYAFGEAYTIRPIQAVDASVVINDKDGAAVVGTLDTETGMFTPAAAWSNGPYSWSGPFYVWVHFDNDYNAFTINSWRASTATVDLEEDKREVTATNVPDSWEE
jgi:uncharacterized protein (TIGR02217 family)